MSVPRIFSSMSQVNQRDVEAIQMWISKEPYLPKTFDEVVIRKFLYSCDNSLERTKRCLEEFCTRRAGLPEVYCARDPADDRMQTIFRITHVTTYIAGNTELLIHRLVEIPDKFDFYDCVKAFTLQADNWLSRPLDVLPEHHAVVMDLKNYTLKLIPKINIFYFQKFIMFLLDSMPVRLTQVHVVNCPSFCDYLYNLVKPALPDYICNMVHFHADHTGLFKFIDKKYLPKDYEGHSESMAEQNAMWAQDICQKRKTFLDDNYWKADLSKKLKTTTSKVEDSLSGSFRVLAID